MSTQSGYQLKGSGPEAYEAYFVSPLMGTLMDGMSSPEGQKLGAALLEDEGNFIDHSKSAAFIVNEHEL